MNKPKLSAAQIRLLEIVMNHPGSGPGWLARKLWPDAKGWSRVARNGRWGAFMPAKAGQILWALWRAKLVRTAEGRWWIMAAGEQAIRASTLQGLSHDEPTRNDSGGFHV